MATNEPTFDLDAARAQRASARAAANATASKPWSFTFGGDTFTIETAPEGIPVAAIKAFEDDKLGTFLQSMLGDQWAQFLTHDPNLEDYLALAAAWAAAAGFAGGPPES